MLHACMAFVLAVRLSEKFSGVRLYAASQQQSSHRSQTIHPRMGIHGGSAPMQGLRAVNGTSAEGLRCLAA